MKKNKHTANTVIGIILSILFLFPFYIMVVSSFKTKRNILEDVVGLPNPFVFTNYPEAWEDLNFIASFSNSLFITTLSITFIVLCTSAGAWALVRFKGKASNIIFYIFVSSMLIPFHSIMLPLIRTMGHDMEAIFGIDMLNKWGLMFMYLGFQSAISIFLYHGFIKGITLEIEEAAFLEGLGDFGIFWKIIFPLLTPMTVTVIIINIIAIWNDYLLPSLVLGEGEETIPLKIFFFFGAYTKQWHLAMAGLTLAILPVITFYFIAQKQIVKGVTAGAIK